MERGEGLSFNTFTPTLMFSTIAFYSSLAGLFILFSFKSLEVKTGAKPFSVFRYKTDMYLRKKASFFVAGLKRINGDLLLQLFGLLLQKIIALMKLILLPIMNRIKQTKLYSIVQGKDVGEMKSGGESEFIKEMSSIKNGNGSGEGTFQNEDNTAV